MSRPVTRGSFKRSCRTCGWTRTYTTAARGDYGKRRHSCSKHLEAAARSERHAARMAAVDRTPKLCHHKEADHVHGTRACYVLDHCRCLPCSKANASAETWRERQKAYGRYDKYVDAEPVRAHVRALGARGMGLKRVAAAAGVSTGTLSKLMFGVYRPTGTGGGRNGPGVKTRQPSKRLLRTTAEKVLAVEPALADGARVPAHGTVLRMRALVRLGWSQSKLAERLGIARSNFTLAAGQWEVTAGTARAAAELYDELSMSLPPQDTHRDRISVSRARNYAAARDWLAPLDLDDDRLDDPGYEPWFETDEGDAVGVDEIAIYRRTHGDRNVQLTPTETDELVRRWAASGRSLADLERVTGIKADRWYRLKDQEGAA